MEEGKSSLLYGGSRRSTGTGCEAFPSVPVLLSFWLNSSKPSVDFGISSGFGGTLKYPPLSYHQTLDSICFYSKSQPKNCVPDKSYLVTQSCNLLHFQHLPASWLLLPGGVQHTTMTFRYPRRPLKKPSKIVMWQMPSSYLQYEIWA